MPELPEVETIRRDLAGLLGATIHGVDVTGTRTIRRHRSPDELIAPLPGTTLAGLERVGKYLLFRLDSGAVVVVHLGMSGQLLLAQPGTSPPAHTHIVVTFDCQRELRFVDPRTFGEVFVSRGDVPELAHLGADALTGIATWRELRPLLGARRKKLKDLLMDQRCIAGIGNIYSDEILWTSRLRHDRPSDTLSAREVHRLFDAIRHVLDAAIEHRGSSLADQQYRDVHGAVGSYAEHHAVFDREGAPCSRCGRPVVRIRYGGRSHFSCTRCQR